MKTYCKPKDIDITDINLISPAIYKAYSGKLRRRDFQRLLLLTCKITREQLDADLEANDHRRINEALDTLALIVQSDIRNRQLRISPLRPFQRRDGLTQKLRNLCKEGAYQQICEYIAVEALMPMFRAKLLPCQFGSIPNRGQVRGVRKIEKIVRRSKKKRLSAIKTDVQKAYPSTKVAMVMALLRRDIGKNEPLLWFIAAVMGNYPNGVLIIGGYLSTWLFNYVMSYVLRAMMAQGKYRRGRWISFVDGIVSYADDTTVFGSYSNLKKALKAACKWAESIGLHIKDCWQIVRFATEDEEKQNHADRQRGSKKRTGGIDMMGFVVRRRCTIIRRRIWRRVRRQLLRAWRNLYQTGAIPWWRAKKATSYKGWLKYSDSEKIEVKYHASVIMQAAGEAVGRHERRTNHADFLHTTA